MASSGTSVALGSRSRSLAYWKSTWWSCPVMRRTAALPWNDIPSTLAPAVTESPRTSAVMSGCPSTEKYRDRPRSPQSR